MVKNNTYTLSLTLLTEWLKLPVLIIIPQHRSVAKYKSTQSASSWNLLWRNAPKQTWKLFEIRTQLLATFGDILMSEARKWIYININKTWCFVAFREILTVGDQICEEPSIEALKKARNKQAMLTRAAYFYNYVLNKSEYQKARSHFRKVQRQRNSGIQISGYLIVNFWDENWMTLLSGQLYPLFTDHVKGNFR